MGKGRAYSTLITRASYLAGVVILAHTLKKHGSQYPLVVFYTPSLSASALHVLELEAPKTNMILRPCELLTPKVKVNLIAERFRETWTKLRVFELIEYDVVCYLDADMAIFKNMDEVFDHVPDLAQDELGVTHTCVCNLENDPWSPADWVPANCAFSLVNHPEALTKPTPKTPASPKLHKLMNSGMFVYRPSQQQLDAMYHEFETSDRLADYGFPDQDFLREFFQGRMVSMGWQYNALKTWRYWHPNMWRDDQVVCLHYIVDKPWVKRVGSDGIAGYKNNDGETHRWWWKAFDDWESERRDSEETLQLVRKFVAAPLGQEDHLKDDADMKAIGSQVQATVKD